MNQVWKRQYARQVSLTLIVCLLQTLGVVSAAAEEGGAGTSAPAVSITFDVYSNISEANLALGGGSSALSLDSPFTAAIPGKASRSADGRNRITG
jgi:hypothetical protein